MIKQDLKQCSVNLSTNQVTSLFGMDVYRYMDFIVWIFLFFLLFCCTQTNTSYVHSSFVLKVRWLLYWGCFPLVMKEAQCCTFFPATLCLLCVFSTAWITCWTHYSTSISTKLFLLHTISYQRFLHLLLHRSPNKIQHRKVFRM